jgi:large subunit ribosomal protein L22
VQASDVVSTARLRYLGTSAQKARLVVDLIRGRKVEEALATLRFTKKAVAPEIGRLLDSAVANAHQKRQDVDVDRLYVKTVCVDGGPSLKRIRPAPMGRAFRVQKRMCHVTIALAERPAGRAASSAKGAATGGGAVTKSGRRQVAEAAPKAKARRSKAAAGAKKRA